MNFSIKQILFGVLVLFGLLSLGIGEVFAQTVEVVPTAGCTIKLTRPDNTFDVTSQCDGGGCGAKTMMAQLNINGGANSIPNVYKISDRGPAQYVCPKGLHGLCQLGNAGGDLYAHGSTSEKTGMEKPCASSFAVGTYTYRNLSQQCQYNVNQYNILVNGRLDRPVIMYSDVAGGTLYGVKIFEKGEHTNAGTWGNSVDMSLLDWNSSTLIDLLYAVDLKPKGDMTTDFSIKYDYRCSFAYTEEQWVYASSYDPSYYVGPTAGGCPTPAPWINNYGPAYNDYLMGYVKQIVRDVSTSTNCIHVSTDWVSCGPCDDEGNCSSCPIYYFESRGKTTTWWYFNGDIPRCKVGDYRSQTYVSNPTHPNCPVPKDQFNFSPDKIDIESTGNEDALRSDFP